MSPVADYLAAYFEHHRDINDVDHFPPIRHDKKFDDMFGSITNTFYKNERNFAAHSLCDLGHFKRLLRSSL
jgi:hypothetical protein